MGKIYPIRSVEYRLDQDNDQASRTGSVLGLLGALAYQIKTLKGAANYSDPPLTTLRTARQHIDNEENPHGVTAEQAEAHPDTWTPSWEQVTEKPDTFPPEEHDHDAIYPRGDTTEPTDGHVWTFDGATGAWLPKATPEGVTEHSELTGTDSPDAHPAATPDSSGFMSAEDKAFFDGLSRATRVHVAPGFSNYDLTLQSTWQDSPLPNPVVTVPALGDPPAGYVWRIDVQGGIRLRHLDDSPTTFFVSVGYDGAATTSVDGGGVIGAEDQGPLFLSLFRQVPPATDRDFTVDLNLFVGRDQVANIRSGPMPVVRAYLVEM